MTQKKWKAKLALYKEHEQNDDKCGRRPNNNKKKSYTDLRLGEMPVSKNNFTFLSSVWLKNPTNRTQYVKRDEIQMNINKVMIKSVLRVAVQLCFNTRQEC